MSADNHRSNHGIIPDVNNRDRVKIGIGHISLSTIGRYSAIGRIAPNLSVARTAWFAVLMYRQVVEAVCRICASPPT
jgi:hypothetical protein